MAPLNPSLPEQQEPNYLRYSRPQNFLEPNKAPGELFKAVGEVFTQGARGIDSTVKSGIDAYVGSKAEAISNEYIHGQLEPEYQRVTGHNPRQDPSTGSLLSSYAEATPQEIKDLPQKMENLEAFKAKGGFVPTYYRAQLDATAKSVRSVFPGFSGYIDRSIAKATGGIEANAYVGQLFSGINSAEAKIDSERKRQENMLDSLAKDGSIKQPIWDGVKKGAIPMDYAISTGVANRYTKQEVELNNSRASLREKNNALDKAQAEHDFDRTAVKGLSSVLDDMGAVHGAYDTPSHMAQYNQYRAGQLRAPSPEQMLELIKTHQTIRQGFVAEQMQANPKLIAEMGTEAAAKKAEHLGQLFDGYTHFLYDKEYANAFSVKTLMNAHSEGVASRFLLNTDPGQIIFNAKAIGAHSPGFVENWISTDVINNTDIQQGLHGAIYEKGVNAAGGPPPGKPAPSLNIDLDLFHNQGVSPSVKQIMLNLPLQITNPKASDKTAKNLVDYGFGGEGSNIWPRLEREVSGRKGGLSVYDNYTKEDFAAKIHSLGEDSWQKYIHSIGVGSAHIMGADIRDLNNLGDRFDVSYDSDHSKIKITPKGGTYGSMDVPQQSGAGHLFSQIGSAFTRRTFNPEQDAVDRMNRVLQGWKNIEKQDPSINANTELLKILQSEGLKDGPVTQQIQRAIMASHKSAAMGPTMNDAGDQMGMGATAMNMMQPGSERSSSDKPVEKLQTAVPAGVKGVPKSSPLNRPSNQDSRNFTRTPVEVPPELTNKAGNEDYLGKGTNVTKETVPNSPAEPISPIQKKLDATLAKGQKAARAHLEAVKEHTGDMKKLIEEEIMRIQERQHALSEGGTAPAQEMSKPDYRAP